ncbi:hypothetical protein SNEBB_001018 [Seison nebaliae]|nr:hypothetical protein SNEBB_001018 [Seison nebaliae]
MDKVKTRKQLRSNNSSSTASTDTRNIERPISSGISNIWNYIRGTLAYEAEAEETFSTSSTDSLSSDKGNSRRKQYPSTSVVIDGKYIYPVPRISNLNRSIIEEAGEV